MILTGCSLPALQGIGSQASTSEVLVQPTPPVRLQLTVVPPSFCEYKTAPVIQTDGKQGNLLAWSPDGSSLAFIAPVERHWGWHSGDLALWNLEAEEPVYTSEIQVTGDLTWSPDGTRIAFVGLRSVDSLYTIYSMVVGNNTITDLFAAGGATDIYASRKGIIGWMDNQRLDIAESCGEDCVRVVRYDVGTGGQTVLEEIRYHEDTSLEIDRNEPDAAVYEGSQLENLSPDGDLIFFLDEREVAWLGSLDDNSMSAVALENGEAQETKWSPNGDFLAIRTEQSLFIIQMNCTGQ